MTSPLISLAIVGAGVMGSVYARTITQTNLRFRARVAAVCDPDAERAQALAATTGARAYTDIEEMLGAEQLDALYLATPDHTHRDPFLACMAAHVPTLVEKPLATTDADAATMRQAAIEAGVVAQTNFTNRWNPVFVEARATLESGGIGDPIGMYARLSNVADYPLHHLAWAANSSCGWFLLSHVLDLGAWLTDWHITSVTARGHKGVLASQGVDTYDLIQALVTYDEGSAMFESCWVLPSSQPSGVEFDFRVYGSTGLIQADTTRQMLTHAGPDKVVYPGILNWTESRLTAFLDDVEAAKAADTPPDPATVLRSGVQNTATLVALHRSLISGVDEPVAQA